MAGAELSVVSSQPSGGRWARSYCVVLLLLLVLLRVDLEEEEEEEDEEQ